ncbi:MAG TPA: TIGR04086 family membrane protein [Egibacteraceae bacterium]|nr:TIGR04086 family membrane protein [Egibacteraceae bacterium]
MARTTRTSESYGAAAAAPSLIRWGAVFGGTVVGLSLLMLLTTLLFALAFGSGMETIEANLPWYIAGAAVLCMFIGGMVAGWLSGVPGAGPGFFNGLSVWALILLAALIVGVPSLVGAAGIDISLADTPNTDQIAAQGDGLWAGFFSLLAGALTAAIGGMIGGVITRPAFAPMSETVITDHGRPMPVGASDRAYDPRDERAYDERAMREEDHRPRDTGDDRPRAERGTDDRPRAGADRRSDGNGWTTST